MSKETLPVIILYEGKGAASNPNWHLSDLVAFFPTIPGTYDPYTMSCYSSVGQHATAHASYVKNTKPATPEQVRKMVKHLEGLGYENLKVVKRLTDGHLAERKRAVEK